MITQPGNRFHLSYRCWDDGVRMKHLWKWNKFWHYPELCRQETMPTIMPELWDNGYFKMLGPSQSQQPSLSHSTMGISKCWAHGKTSNHPSHIQHPDKKLKWISGQRNHLTLSCTVCHDRPKRLQAVFLSFLPGYGSFYWCPQKPKLLISSL